jgi:predicted nucleic acid-binding protein
MTTYLLDVNLLFALSDPMHIHHQPAHRWFVEEGHQAWATCPLTENRFNKSPLPPWSCEKI